MTLTEISDQLQNPETEAERLGAYGALTLYLDENPTDQVALELYDKYRVLDRDWTREVASTL